MSSKDTDNKDVSTDSRPDEAPKDSGADAAVTPSRPKEIGGRDGPDPTRYGDWEKAGRCIDF